MLEAGKILQERYRIEKHIGQGGMGAVYVATDQRFGSTVAIKETLFTDDKFRRAFEREARLMNSLRHPALPRVSDHFIEGNGQFLVMEYIPGEDLSVRLEAEGDPYPASDVLDWADQLLDALDYLHSQAMPVIHRDIKPQNLKLTPEGKVVLLDFGLAKGNVTNPESATAAKSVFGYSRNYASLEQIQGTGTDPRSDLYSLAATVYHLLAGTPPVDALTRAMDVLSRKPDPLAPLSAAMPELPADVDRVLMRALSLNAAERPATAAEMRSLLAAARSGADMDSIVTVVNPPTDTDLLTQQTRISEKQSAIGTVAFSERESASRIPVSARTSGLEGATRIQRHMTDSPKPGRRFAAAVLGGLALVAAGAGAVFFLYNDGPRRNAEVPPVQDERPFAATNTESNRAGNSAEPANSETNRVRTLPKDEVTTTANQKPAAVKTPGTPAATVNEPPAEPATGRDNRPGEVRQPDGDLRPPPGPDGERISPEFWRKLTPEQRRKLRRAIEMEREMQRRENRSRPVPPPPSNQ